MKVESIRTLHGPNVYSYRPVLLMSLDLGELVERESREFNGFNDKLLTLLPGIHNHHCSLGRPGGFVTRLEEGTYFGHIVEHVALELTELTGIGKSHGKTRHNTGSTYNVAIEFRSEKASTYLLEQAVKLVEEMLAGRNYRVVIIGGRMVAASERMLPHVIGDGVSAISDLIATENRNPLRGDGHEKPLTKIKVDSDVIMHLQHNGMSLDTVPKRGEHVTLSNRSNLSTGATAQDVTDQVHPSIARLCERAARLIGLDVSGVDLVIPDIATPIETGGVIELNASPGLRMHHYPSAGMPRDVGQAVVDAIYPPGAPSRIPIISITGTNGKTTVTRMIGHVLNTTGLCVGMTTTDGIYIDGERVVDGDTTGPQSAQVVLGDPAVEAAVLETARGGILRRGLGYDWSDIGVMTNISDDHIGQDGIKSVEDVVYIKSLVAERVKEGGTLILNADDEHLAKMMECERVNRVPKQVVYFSLDENNPVVKSHLKSGGTAYFARNKRLIETIGETQHTLADVSMLPVMMNGAADFQISNLLATIAACRAFGIEHDVLLKSLINFSSWANNPGRANLYRLNGGHVMVDYGHNTEAFGAICRMTSRWNDRQVTGIISVPGDRDDSIIDRAARAAAKGFDKIIIREDHDLRGRKQGDVANILCQAIRETSPATECEVILDEIEALRQAVSRMVKNEVIVVFYEKLQPIQTVLQELAAQPVVALPPPVKQERTMKRLSAVNRPRRLGKRLVPALPA